jgi:Family of unknown function (DUF6600)/Sigma-70 region 2
MLKVLNGSHKANVAVSAMASSAGEPSSDGFLVSRIAAGDKLAMQALFARHRTSVYRWLLRFVRSESVAENLLNEVFLDLWRKADRFEGRPSVSTWLLSIARYKALSARPTRREDQVTPEIESTLVDWNFFRSAALMALSLAFTLAPVTVQAQRSNFHAPPGAFQMQRVPAPMAQPRNTAQLSGEFRTALQPRGQWRTNSRWGEVWIPNNRPRDWRPYTVGRWTYTNDWGWYWISDDDEADWGWVTYHYGRWAYDDDFGWCWVPGYDWGPAFVDWRYGSQFVGWAALPPDEMIVEYRSRPDFWIFVNAGDLVAPRIASVILPFEQTRVVFRETAVVNQPVFFGERGFAVNPGIQPGIIAAAAGRPLRAYDVSPRVLAGTAAIAGATVIGAQQLRAGNIRGGASVRQSQNVIQPSHNASRPQPLAAGERGRLGANPPRAAAQPVTTGQQPRAGQAIQPQQGREQPRQAQQPQGRPPSSARGQGLQPQQQGQSRTAIEQRQQMQREQTQRQQTRPDLGTTGRSGRDRAGQTGRAQQQQQQLQTEGRSAVQQRQFGPSGRGAAERPQRPERVQPQQRLSTEGRGAIQQRQPGPERRAIEPRARPELGTMGRGGPTGRTQAPPRVQPQQRLSTEGRGGGGGPSIGAGPQPRGPVGGMAGPGGGGVPHGGGAPHGGGGPPHR